MLFAFSLLKKEKINFKKSLSNQKQIIGKKRLSRFRLNSFEGSKSKKRFKGSIFKDHGAFGAYAVLFNKM